jgi:3'-phosphoadenosine 5'-phosphosulfate (PAPS) 3'-phosphatase
MAASLQPQTVPLHKLLSTCIDAAGRGCACIRSVQESGGVDAQLKIQGDPKSALTAADLAAQAAVVGALAKAWPGLTIIGEEDESVFAEDFELDVPLDDSILNGEPTVDLASAKIKIFVDPLDGTREFVEGRLSAVQCLVGVVVGDTPVAGAVGIPFPADGGPPRVIWATAGGAVGGDAPRAEKRADDAPLLVVAGDGSDPAQVAAVAAFRAPTSRCSAPPATSSNSWPMGPRTSPYSTAKRRPGTRALRRPPSSPRAAGSPTTSARRSRRTRAPSEMR